MKNRAITGPKNYEQIPELANREEKGLNHTLKY